MSELAPSDAKGRYKRPASSLQPTADSMAPSDTTDEQLVSTVYDVFADRADKANPVVYLGVACPWCHRVALTIALLGVRGSYDVRRVAPGSDGLWRLAQMEKEDDGVTLLKDVYLTLDGAYAGRFTAPVMVDVDRSQILSNESADIVAMLGTTHGLTRRNADSAVWLRGGSAMQPGGQAQVDVDVDVHVDWADMEMLCERIYNDVNDGVYRCGFATAQPAYEEAEQALFGTLDECERRLGESRFLCSDAVVTEADVRLFPTIFRFDSVYALLFRASRKTVRCDYPMLSRWLRDIYNMDGVKDTCDLPQTVQEYYGNLFPLNASGIVPVPPHIDLSPL